MSSRLLVLAALLVLPLSAFALPVSPPGDSASAGLLEGVTAPMTLTPSVRHVSVRGPQ
ncbi:MAG: hypothetical protein AB1511_07070 [Deinococcota bacterium]